MIKFNHKIYNKINKNEIDEMISKTKGCLLNERCFL